jgi:hypothetical protein
MKYPGRVSALMAEQETQQFLDSKALYPSILQTFFLLSFFARLLLSKKANRGSSFI